MKCDQSGPGFELVSPCPCPATITITLRAPPYWLLDFNGLLTVYVNFMLRYLRIAMVYIYINVHWVREDSDYSMFHQCIDEFSCFLPISVFLSIYLFYSEYDVLFYHAYLYILFVFIIYSFSGFSHQLPGLSSVFWPISIIVKFECSPLIQLFPGPLVNPLVTIPGVPIIIGNTVTFMFHCFCFFFFNFLTRSKYLSFFSHSLNFTQWSARIAKSTIKQFSFPC